LGRASAHEGTQVDVVPHDFVVGSYEPGNHHGMGDRLVIRECPSWLTSFPRSFGVDLDWNSCRNSTILSIRIYPSLLLLWRPTLSFGGMDSQQMFAGVQPLSPFSIVSLALHSQCAGPLYRILIASLTNPSFLSIVVCQQNVHGPEPSMGIYCVGHFRPPLCAYPLRSYEVRLYLFPPQKKRRTHTFGLSSKFDLHFCTGLDPPYVPNQGIRVGNRHLRPPRPNIKTPTLRFSKRRAAKFS
jgi:hypothetical protein